MGKYYIQTGTLKSIIDRPNHVDAVKDAFKNSVKSGKPFQIAETTFVSEFGFLNSPPVEEDNDRYSKAIQNALNKVKNADCWVYSTFGIIKSLGLSNFFKPTEQNNPINEYTDGYEDESEDD
jgi:hypothetical protein